MKSAKNDVKKILLIICKMETINFGDKEVDKREFYINRDAILLDKVNFNKIVVSNEIIVDNNSKKYVLGTEKMI